MTIPSEKLIDQITNILILSEHCNKQFKFKTVNCIDNLDVTLIIYLNNKMVNINSSFRIRSR